MGKGGAFEREICRDLSLWWSSGAKDDIFYRTSGSGGRFTHRQKRGKITENDQGDVGFTDVDGKALMDLWLFELKTGYPKSKSKLNNKIQLTQWCLLDLLDGKEQLPTLLSFWLQVTEGANSVNKQPILIFRRLFKQACIAVRLSYFLTFLVSMFGYPATTCSISIDLNHPKLKEDDQQIIILPIKDFFVWTKNIRRVIKPEGCEK
jgi:hypothetical protein